MAKKKAKKKVTKKKKKRKTPVYYDEKKSGIRSTIGRSRPTRKVTSGGMGG